MNKGIQTMNKYLLKKALVLFLYALTANVLIIAFLAITIDDKASFLLQIMLLIPIFLVIFIVELINSSKVLLFISLTRKEIVKNIFKWLCMIIIPLAILYEIVLTTYCSIYNPIRLFNLSIAVFHPKTVVLLFFIIILVMYLMSQLALLIMLVDINNKRKINAFSVILYSICIILISLRFIMGFIVWGDNFAIMMISILLVNILLSGVNRHLAFRVEGRDMV